MSHIPYARQWVNQEDVDALIAVLNSDWLTQGPVIAEFEKKVAQYCGVRYAVAVANGTAALHIACQAAGLGSGDLLWTSPNTFTASANCAFYCNATPDFVDIDPSTYNLSVEELETKLVDAEKTGSLPKVVIPVHFAGQSCDMERIQALSRRYGFTVIEDACHAIGGNYKNRKVGSCQFSDMAVFSFHPAKVITSGEGGLITTNSEETYEKLCLLRTHGITKDERFMEGNSIDGPWYYQQIELGMNYRISDIHAALGLSQLTRIDSFVLRRHELVECYNKELADLPITLPWQHADTWSAFHLYVIRLNLDEINQTRKEVFERLRAENIGVNVHYIPVHTQPYYRRHGFSQKSFPEAEKYYSETITLPLYPLMTKGQQDYVIEALKEILHG